MNLYRQIETWLVARHQQQVHRQLLIVSGQENWAIAQALMLVKQREYLWVGQHQAEGTQVTHQQYQGYLGQEFEIVVLNCFSGFKANAAIALSGTIKAKGLMILICPSFASWPKFQDPEWLNRVSYGYQEALQHSHFIDKLIARVTSDENVAVLTAEKFTGTIPQAKNLDLNADLMPIKALQEQQEAINSIIKVATGHRNRPLVLSADRGRGKSSALGIAAAQLIKDAAKKIVIVAPSPHTVQQVFKHAEKHLPHAVNTKNKLSLGDGYLHYVAPDAILTTHIDIDLLLIDEAAALPTHLLFKLIDRYSRIVFSTTLHGYEGSGRGFELRVKQYLNRVKPEWRGIHLNQAMRWFNGDCLESFWFDLFCITSHSSQPEKVLQGPTTLSYITKTQLADDAQLSFRIFQLLIDAHYQTSPDDLIRLFDSPEQHCYVLKRDNVIIGVALIIAEGGEILAPLQHDITCGKRRVKGHLVAQNITFNFAQSEFCTLKQWRITRIAIAADYQRQGLGNTLLTYLTQEAKTQEISFLTSSFGLNQGLLHFWHQAGFTVVNMSKKPEVSSSEHSAQLLLPLSPQAHILQQSVVTEFTQEVLYHCDKSFKDIDPLLLHHILLQVKPTQAMSDNNLQIVAQFIDGSRPLHLCKRQLRDYYLSNIIHFKHLDDNFISLLLSLLLQNHSEIDIAKIHNFSNVKEIQQILRLVTGSIFSLN